MRAFLGLSGVGFSGLGFSGSEFRVESITVLGGKAGVFLAVLTLLPEFHNTPQGLAPNP